MGEHLKRVLAFAPRLQRRLHGYWLCLDYAAYIRTTASSASYADWDPGKLACHPVQLHPASPCYLKLLTDSPLKGCDIGWYVTRHAGDSEPIKGTSFIEYSLLEPGV